MNERLADNKATASALDEKETSKTLHLDVGRRPAAPRRAAPSSFDFLFFPSFFRRFFFVTFLIKAPTNRRSIQPFFATHTHTHTQPPPLH